MNTSLKNMHSLYQQQIMDHYHFPRYKGFLRGTGCVSSAHANPSCGDQVSLSLCIRNRRLVDGRFEGVGCILSLAAADMLIEHTLNKTTDELKALTAEDIKKMIGIEVGHTRIKCILLPFDALKDILNHA